LPQYGTADQHRSTVHEKTDTRSLNSFDTTRHRAAKLYIIKIYTPVFNMIRFPISRKISDLCKISDLLLFVSYFASQIRGIKFGNYFFGVSCANSNFLVSGWQILTTSYSTRK